jgi:hypothetical protein
MSVIPRVLAALAAAETPLGISSIMVKTGLDRSLLANALTRLVQSDRISRKTQGMYFMTPEQRAKVDYLQAPALPVQKFGAGIAAADLSQRLHRLLRISSLPAFEGDAVLGYIINDYRRALDRVTGQEDSRYD